MRRALDNIRLLVYNFFIAFSRGVAQIGSALPWGGRGRGFKSRHPDHIYKNRLK